ncbi:MAG: XRE family transcriptional regulator [Dehalococcoidia bacterium]
MTAAMERIAYREAFRASIPEVVSYLQDLFGGRLTAVIADVPDASVVGQWARGDGEPQRETEQTLRAAYQVARLLRQSESEQSVQSWFMGMNPYLDDRAPALAIGQDSLAVLQAARALLVSG